MARAKTALAGTPPPVSEEAAPARLTADKRRKQLLQIAVDLFSRKGFNGTTTREIASAAGVTEAIIFRHFQTKEHLYRAIIDRRVNAMGTAEWMAKGRTAMDRNDDSAVIRHLIAAIISTHKEDPKFERVMLYAALEGNETALQHMRQVTASIVDEYRTYFSRRQKQSGSESVGPDAALIAIVGMAQAYASKRYIHGLEERCLSDEQALDSFTRIAMDGLCLKKRPVSVELKPSKKSEKR